MAWGPGIEPGFSEPKSDVLPIRRPPNLKTQLAWGLGFEPRFSEPESDVLPVRRSPKQKTPAGQYLPGIPSRRQTTARLQFYEGWLDGLLLVLMHFLLATAE